MFTRDVYDRLDALYAELPKMNCQGKCKNCCGPLAVFNAEGFRMLIVSGGRPLTYDSETMQCGYLNPEDRCSIYESRPLLCRLWGLVSSMPCLFGCVPERFLTEEEGRAFMARVQDIAGSAIIATPKPR